MTDPSWPAVGQSGYSARYPGQPDMWAPYGRHPVSGQPYSDKLKVTAALLQLLGIFGFLGFGRIYLGYVGLGIAQLLICLFATVTTYGIGLGLPFVWGVIEAVLILSGRVGDKQGRLLRDGT